MDKRNRTQLVLGILLVLAAAWLVISQVNPAWTGWLRLVFDWPVWIMLAGAGLLLIGLAVGNPEMAVPACIVAGIGGILYYQNISGDWSSWSYMWTLLPGLGGLGNLLSAVIGGTLKQEGRHAVNTIFVSIILFAIFATIFGGLKIFGPYKDYALIGLLFVFGLWLILRGIFRKQQP
jgi:hypothetical protein